MKNRAFFSYAIVSRAGRVVTQKADDGSLYIKPSVSMAQKSPDDIRKAFKVASTKLRANAS